MNNSCWRECPLTSAESAELAAGFVVLLKESNPNVRAFNWQTEPKTKSNAGANISGFRK